MEAVRLPGDDTFDTYGAKVETLLDGVAADL